jgi:PAS domain S-box-containing protein
MYTGETHMANTDNLKHSKHVTPGNARPTIGLMCVKPDNECSINMWSGVRDTAWEHGVNLVYFAGGELGSPVYEQANIVYELVNPEHLNGLVIWGTQLAHYADFEGLKTFCQRYSSLPIINIGLALEGIPSLLADQYQGMYDVVTHLIEEHGYRRIAYMQGSEDHPEARERYRGYTEALKKHRIPLEPVLVATWREVDEWSRRDMGGWMRTSDAGIYVLLDGHGLRPKVDFDAVVGQSDGLSLVAVKELQTRGIRVPGDVAMASFDDTSYSRYITPPLTAVRYAFYDLGCRAAEMLLARLRGENVPEQVLLPMQVMIRQSCGCVDPAVKQAAAGLVVEADDLCKVTLNKGREIILAEVVELVAGKNENWLFQEGSRLLDAFFAELGEDSPGNFLSALDETLCRVAAKDDVSALQGFVSILRQQILPYLKNNKVDTSYRDRAENLWQQARVMIGETAKRTQAYQALLAEQQSRMLREIGARLITTFHVTELMDVLARELPRLNIPGCYLALYENPQPYTYLSPAPKWSRLVLAYDEQRRMALESDGQRFPSRHLAPEQLLSRERPYSIVVEPLYFRKHQIGFSLFEVGPQEGYIYDILRGEISSALQGALLVQQVQEHAAELARKQYVLDTFMETVPDRICFKDLEGRITRANKAHAVKVGLNNPIEEIGKTDFDFLPAEQARIISKQEQEIIRSGIPLINMEEPTMWIGGRVDWSLTTRMPLRDEHGDIIGTFSISRDITTMKQAEEDLKQYREHLQDLVNKRTAELTRINSLLQEEIAERKRAEYAVRLSEQQYRLLAENVMDGIVIVQAGKLVFVNAVFAALVGIPATHLLQQEIITLFASHEKSSVHDRLTPEKQDAPVPPWQAEIMIATGNPLWVEVSQTAIMWEGQPALLLTIRNIHASKLREQRLEQERERLRQENLTFKSTLTERYKFGEIVGKSPAMQQIYTLIVSAAASDVNVLLCGESGTGKELIARTIHQVTARKHQAFVPVNCASIPETLFEREFFGHRKGAFTGADRDCIGLFDRAHRGTLFLDEVTELSPGMQAKLLRALQDGEYFPVGSVTPKQADVLIIAATNKDWKTLIEQGLLRKDFFYRICVIEIRVPPLREHKEDIPLLIEHILEQYRQKQEHLHGTVPDNLPSDQTMLPGEFVQTLYTYHWPGNVRELQNVLQRYLVTHQLDAAIQFISPPKQEIRTVSDAGSVPDGITLSEAVKALEKRMIADALAHTHYRIGKTAEKLGMPRRTLQYKIKKYQLMTKA